MILAKVWLDRKSLREQLKDCSAAFDRQQEQLDRNAEQIAALREKLAKKEDNGTTHWAGCSESGARHYKCALLEIGRLRDTVTDLRVKLEAADNRNTRNYYADGYEAGYQAGMAEWKPWVDLTKEELQTIFNYEPNDVKHIAFLVESLCKEKNGG